MSETPHEAGVPPLTLGWRLKMSLEFAGITVNQMAEQLGYSRTHVSRWMNDKIVPRRSVLRDWALRCGVPFVWLRDGTIPPDGPGSNIARCLTLPGRRGREREGAA